MKKFTNEHTNMIKGIALIFLLFHHLFYKAENMNFCITLFPQEITVKLAVISKMCVTIFLILSGYGLMKSAEKSQRTVGIEFSLTHIIKIMWELVHEIDSGAFITITEVADVYKVNM